MTRALWLVPSFAVVLAGTACSEESEPNRGKMNISSFAYRDVNRNGIYDLPDRPYAGLKVVLEHPDGRRSTERSNIAGFANFAMSRNNDAYEITAPGRYRVAADAPRGWRISSDSGSQELNIKVLDGSPGGLVAAETLVPIGLAPELTINGALDPQLAGDPAEYSVVATSEGGRSLRVPVSNRRDYTVEAGKGTWTLTFQGSRGPVAERVVALSDYPVTLSEVAPDRRYAKREGSGTIIGFDDLTRSDTLYEVPNGYAGLNWHNWIATHQKFYEGYGYINATVSGEYVAYNSSGHPAVFSSLDPFDFLSAYVGVAWTQAEQGFVYIKGWRHGELIYRDRIRCRTSGPVKFEADYKDVTRVEFSTEHYWQVVVDDIEVSGTGP